MVHRKPDSTGGDMMSRSADIVRETQREKVTDPRVPCSPPPPPDKACLPFVGVWLMDGKRLYPGLSEPQVLEIRI